MGAEIRKKRRWFCNFRVGSHFNWLSSDHTDIMILVKPKWSLRCNYSVIMNDVIFFRRITDRIAKLKFRNTYHSRETGNLMDYLHGNDVGLSHVCV